MSDTVTLSVSLNTTSDGFISQECPACERVFKVAAETSEPATKHCPYCNHEGEDCWWTTPQIDYMTAFAEHKLIVPRLQKMTRDLNQKSRGGFVTISASMKTPPTPVAPAEDDDMQASVSFACCGETIHHDGNASKLHCPSCGTAREA